MRRRSGIWTARRRSLEEARRVGAFPRNSIKPWMKRIHHFLRSGGNTSQLESEAGSPASGAPRRGLVSVCTYAG